ncbi:MAG: type 4a pilus biogenesis protein PilO [Candidatus Latescibacterota bacterium]|jgi:type IV pilus assembly protein PilO
MNLKDPTVQKTMLGVMAVVILSYVYFGTSFLPFNYPVRKAKIEALEKEYAKLSAELEKARQMVGNLARLEAEYERLHDQWLSAQDLLPEEKEMPELLRQVTTAGNKSGVRFALFEPQPPTPKEFFSEHPIKIKVRGNYHQVGIFLSRLANMSRIVNVSKLELTSNEGPKGKKKGQTKAAKNMNTVEASFVLSAYTLLGGIENEEVQADS